MTADYNDVFKDKCAAEFLRLKECYLVSPSWGVVDTFGGLV